MPRPLPPDVVARAGGSETEAVRDHILDAALRVVATQGLAAASTRAVAAEAGIGAGTVYNYFDNRVELLSQAIVRRVRALAQPLDDLTDRAGKATVTVNLRRVVRVATALLDDIVPLFAAAFSEAELMQALHQHLATSAHGAIDPVARVERYLLAERELGRIADDADCRAAATTLISLCHDQAFHRFFSRATGPAPSLSREVDLVVRALR